MCLSVPARIISIEKDMAIASVNGVQMEISLQLVENVKEGDDVLVHTGYALQVLSKDDAKEAQENLLKMQQSQRENGWDTMIN